MITYAAIKDMLKGQRWPHTLALIISVAVSSSLVTVKMALVARGIEVGLTKELADINKKIERQGQRLDERMRQMQTQLDRAWTLDMQTVRDMMVAGRNTNNWIPDSHRIYEAVRSGKPSDAVQIRP